jgi:hypothetical protein
MEQFAILLSGTLVVGALSAARRRRPQPTAMEVPGERLTLRGAPWTP